MECSAPTAPTAVDHIDQVAKNRKKRKDVRNTVKYGIIDLNEIIIDLPLCGIYRWLVGGLRCTGGGG